MTAGRGLTGLSHSENETRAAFPRGGIESPQRSSDDTSSRDPPRPVRDPRAARRGRDGRGLQGAGHAAGADGGGEGAAVAPVGVVRSRASGSSGRRRRSRSSRILTSARCTTSGREGETEYLVMELLEGETLSERLAKGALPLEQTLRYGSEIADALDKAHRQGIVHRDLKPGNVMLTKSGVKLLDFGLAKAMAPASAASLTSLPTQQGADAGRARSSGRSSTWRRSSSRARKPTRGRTSSRSARCSTRWRREGRRSRVEPGVADHGDHADAIRRRSPGRSRCRRRRSTGS